MTKTAKSADSLVENNFMIPSWWIGFQAALKTILSKIITFECDEDVSLVNTDAFERNNNIIEGDNSRIIGRDGAAGDGYLEGGAEVGLHNTPHKTKSQCVNAAGNSTRDAAVYFFRSCGLVASMQLSIGSALCSIYQRQIEKNATVEFITSATIHNGVIFGSLLPILIKTMTRMIAHEDPHIVISACRCLSLLGDVVTAMPDYRSGLHESRVQRNDGGLFKNGSPDKYASNGTNHKGSLPQEVVLFKQSVVSGVDECVDAITSFVSNTSDQFLCDVIRVGLDTVVNCCSNEHTGIIWGGWWWIQRERKRRRGRIYMNILTMNVPLNSLYIY